VTTVRGSIGSVTARSGTDRTAGDRTTGPTPPTPFLFRNGIGLFLAAAAFFVAGALVWWLLRPVGPGSFPLSSLCVLLGFVAAIGGTLAYFFGREDPFAERVPAPAVAKRTEPAALPPPVPVDFGRPRPEVRRGPARSAPSSGLGAAVAASVAPPPIPAPTAPSPVDAWSEEGVEPAKGPASETPNPPAVDEALAELARIERDMSLRKGRAPRER